MNIYMIYETSWHIQNYRHIAGQLLYISKRVQTESSFSHPIISVLYPVVHSPIALYKMSLAIL